MPDWDEDSPDLKRNLEGILNEIVDRADKRDAPNVEMARNWQILVMQDLEPEDGNTDYIGRFRGEPGVEYIQVHVDDNWGTDSQIVAAELQRFEATLKRSVAELDSLLPWGQNRDKDQKAAVIDVCAWAHTEWIRIHPFANGNGRTARLWANFIAARYNLPPFVRLRPRPTSGYKEAGERAMHGEWRPTIAVFRQLLLQYESEIGQGPPSNP